MVLNLSEVLVTDAVIPFDFSLDLSDLDFYSIHPLSKPCKVSGEVSSRAGIVTLSLKVDYTYLAPCDRCAVETERDYSVSVERTLVKELFDLDDERYILIDGDELDVGELARTEVILSVPGKFLCSDGCKGICDVCGINRNHTECDCYAEQIDPRLAALKELLK